MIRIELRWEEILAMLVVYLIVILMRLAVHKWIKENP